MADAGVPSPDTMSSTVRSGRLRFPAASTGPPPLPATPQPAACRPDRAVTAEQKPTTVRL